MALTENTLALRALELAGLPETELPRVVSQIPAGLELLGLEVRSSPDYADMQADFPATPVAGLLDLSAIDGILFDMGRSTVRVSATNQRLTPIDDLLTLQDGRLPSDAVYYAQDGRGLRFRSATPSLTDYATAVKIRANYVPSLIDSARSVPLRFEGRLVALLASLVAVKEAA
jgi:hypothetical protein